MFKTLILTQSGPIARLTLNQPEKLNPLSTQRLLEIIEAVRQVNRDESIRVLIVAGEGRAFSAGADISAFGVAGDMSARERADVGRQMADAVEAIRAVTIARIQGWCVGGALVLAAACDLRVATEDAKFSIPEIDLGIPLAWGGIPRLVREIGPALTKELVMTCRPFDAAEAKGAGFLNRVVPAEQLDTVVDALAQQIAAKPALPIIATKRHVNAVTEQMVGTMRAWSDADGLLAGLSDPECDAARLRYMEQRKGSKRRADQSS